MHRATIERHRHAHVFLGASHDHHERRTRLVVLLTLVTMAVEIAAGTAFGSLALLADGWHMATHAGALGLSAAAYAFARARAHDPRYSFGTGKVGDLAGFGSAIALALVALWIAAESVTRIVTPVAIRFDEAIAVAGLGLAVNLVSAALLHEHGHDHGADASGHAHADHNLRSARLHVLADALTSVLATFALLAGRFLGLPWLDPAAGLLGAAMIASWSYGLLRDTARVLLDVEPDPALVARVRELAEGEGGDRLADCHVWRIGPGHCAAIVAVVTRTPQPAAHYRQRLAAVPGLAHVTVEVIACEERCGDGP